MPQANYVDERYACFTGDAFEESAERHGGEVNHTRQLPMSDFLGEMPENVETGKLHALETMILA